jgi:monoamine oxidase
MTMAAGADTDYLAIIQNGLQPRAERPARIIVIGAGMAGLSAAYELARAGHEPIVLEGRARVGGRVFTLREPFTPGLYAEAGAMRIPRTHHLTLGYVDKFGLTVSPFTMNNPKAFFYLHGQKHRIGEAEANPDVLGFDVAEHERGKTAAQLWEAALQPITQYLVEQGPSAWSDLVAWYDGYSTRKFLEEHHWSEGAIEMFGLLTNLEALMNSSFLEVLREEVGHCYVDLVQLDGGMDSLPRAFLPALQSRIRFGARVTALDQSTDDVTVHYQTLQGRAKVSGDYAIVTIPLAVLRHVEVLTPFSRAKQRAIRQLHYDASAKIYVQCRRRFWEEDDGIFGGGSITDLAIRNVYYPEHGRETGRGVLLGSYTWSEDAQRWGSLEPNDRIIQTLEDLAVIHPQVTDEFEVGASKIWHHDEFAGGAFALFDPGQQTLLYDAITAPEGRFFFAGEHASLAHAWIQGAIESGLRAATEVHAIATRVPAG